VFAPLSFIVVCISAAGAQAPARDTVADRQAIVRLEENWRAAQQHNDTSAFAQLLAPDLTFIGTSGSLRDRADYVASRAGSWIPRAASFRVTELRVRLYGNTAVVTGRESTTGTGVTYSGRFTHVWLLRQGLWQLVAIQRTDVAPAEAPH
jgi:uncharacterized protein (TIGR02246 family)